MVYAYCEKVNHTSYFPERIIILGPNDKVTKYGFVRKKLSSLDLYLYPPTWVEQYTTTLLSCYDFSFWLWLCGICKIWTYVCKLVYSRNVTFVKPKTIYYFTLTISLPIQLEVRSICEIITMYFLLHYCSGKQFNKHYLKYILP